MHACAQRSTYVGQQGQAKPATPPKDKVGDKAGLQAATRTWTTQSNGPRGVLAATTCLALYT
ncbi:uncharacterized protein SETTUDRAFT_162773 [Exserohilum turcica Et28A]|uniref:Uncharacterized protein n=1 Tax=Exserohilum turcicum (strain 28A) TaxID=671987 RepID=R0KAP7_EXST2|nr:uncharacterized protein SETTUDRAFT_162773 [Exserohilum turcica Et28A]EOA86499.1 hypothetical protein SETTUDRAFT_162773 [Exserohilum turcica Et28A]